MNFFDILKNVCIIAHEDIPVSFNDSSNPYPEIKQYIKNINEEICSKYHWTFRERIYSFKTVAGQKEYSLEEDILPANILSKGFKIKDTTDFLTFILHNDLDSLTVSSGKPLRYSFFASKLVLDPIPDSVYNIEIKYLTSDFAIEDNLEKLNLELENDISIIPERYIKTLIWGAYSLYRQNFKTDEKFKAAQNKYLDYLTNMKKENNYGQDSSPVIVI